MNVKVSGVFKNGSLGYQIYDPYLEARFKVFTAKRHVEVSSGF
jgi:hypothetical protein